MIPDFLNPENRPDGEDKMMDALERYRNHFGKDVTTECSSFTEDEWIELLDLCIKEDKQLDNYLSPLGDDEYI